MAAYAYVAHLVTEAHYVEVTGDAKGRRIVTEDDVKDAMVTTYAKDNGIPVAKIVVVEFAAIRQGD